MNKSEGFNQLNNFIKNKINAKRYSTGFTMIELIVVISLILVFSGVIISNFSSAKLQFSLSRVAYQLEQDLSKAQNMALSSVPYKDSLGVEHQVDGYGVYVNLTGLGNTKYIVYADKSPGNNKYDTSDYLIKQVDFSLNEPGIIIQNMFGVSGGNTTSVNFKSVDLSTSIDNLLVGSNSVSFYISEASELFKTKTVSINTAGLIQVTNQFLFFSSGPL